MFKSIVCYMLVLGGCASVEARLPVPDAQSLRAETLTQEQHAFARYENMLVRLDRVSTKILRVNTELCPKTAPDIGARTHSKKSYSKHIRKSAAHWLGAGAAKSVLLVPESSPAGQAGLRRGDVLLNAKGKPTGAHGKHVLDTDNRLHIQRRGEDLVLQVEPVLACDYQVVLRMSGAINAYATGRAIIVTTAMMDFAQTDAELALIVGHELAHNTMGHVPKIMRNMILSGFATRYTRPFEAEADYVGLYHMARAGYDISGVEVFWRRLGVANPKSIVRAKTHPITPSRLLSIQLTAAEIQAKREAGEPLVPNMLTSE